MAPTRGSQTDVGDRLSAWCFNAGLVHGPELGCGEPVARGSQKLLRMFARLQSALITAREARRTLAL